MSDNTNARNRPLAEVYRGTGHWSEVYIDMSVDTADPPQVKEERRRSVVESLAKQGAPKADLDAIEDALELEIGEPSPVCLFLLAKDGVVLINEQLPGYAVEPETVNYGPLPNLVPLLKHQPQGFCYLVVEAARDSGEVRLYRAGASRAETDEVIQGRTDTLHKTSFGGWRQDHMQNHVVEIWRRNQVGLAAAIDEIVRTERPRLLVVSGDIRARQLLENELSVASKAILAVETIDSRAGGSNERGLSERVNSEVERLMAAEKKEILDRLNLRSGRGNNTTELRIGGIVEALAGGQVDILLLDSDRLREHQLLSLAAAPWIASDPEETLGAAVIAKTSALLAMVRAALLTDARVMFTDSLAVPDAEDAITLPNGAPAAALLRWRTGPPVPGAR